METNPKLRMMDLVSLSINMMKSNFTGKNLGLYLNKLLKRLNNEEIAAMLQRLFDFDPFVRQKFLTEILAL